MATKMYRILFLLAALFGILINTFCLKCILLAVAAIFEAVVFGVCLVAFFEGVSVKGKQRPQKN